MGIFFAVIQQLHLIYLKSLNNKSTIIAQYMIKFYIIFKLLFDINCEMHNALCNSINITHRINLEYHFSVLLYNCNWGNYKYGQ